MGFHHPQDESWDHPGRVSEELGKKRTDAKGQLATVAGGSLQLQCSAHRPPPPPPQLSLLRLMKNELQKQGFEFGPF